MHPAQMHLVSNLGTVVIQRIRMLLHQSMSPFNAPFPSNFTESSITGLSVYIEPKVGLG